LPQAVTLAVFAAAEVADTADTHPGQRLAAVEALHGRPHGDYMGKTYKNATKLRDF
jgi:hypothetical protein